MDGLPLQLLKAVTPAFEEETGAKVLFDTAFYMDAHAKAMVNLAAGTGAYDLVNWGTEFGASMYQYLEPLDEYIAKDDPGIADFIPNVADMMKIDGHWYALPYRVTAFCLAYRKDLFEKNGITKLDTMSDLYDAAKKLTQDTDGDGKIDQWGLALIGDQRLLSTYTNSFLWAFGADYFDDHWKPLTNSKEFVKALEFYISLFEYSVPGSKTFSDDEVLTAMQQGKAAMSILESPYIAKMQDKNLSQVWDKIFVHSTPVEDPSFKANYLWAAGHSIPKDSKNKELAYLYLKYLVKPESVMAMAKIGGNLPVRISIFEDPVMEKIIQGFSEYKKAMLTGRSVFALPEGDEIFSIYGEELGNAMVGSKTVKQATDDMTERILKVMQTGGYYK
jgi:multiple sugar transport system substrate-binding protein